MSQEAVERTIGKLATDGEFRAGFFANPAAATWEAGLALSRVELEALSALSLPAVTRFSQSLDPRISRLCLYDAPAEGACARRRLRDAERDVIVDTIMREARWTSVAPDVETVWPAVAVADESHTGELVFPELIGDIAERRT